MIIRDLLPGKMELIVLAIILSMIFSYEIIGVIRKIIAFLKK